MAVTRLGYEGYGVRRASSFSGKSPETFGSHPVGKVTRLSADGYGARRAGSFFGKTLSSNPGGSHPVSKVTRLGPDGYGSRRYRVGGFSGKATSGEPTGGGGPHPVSRLTRLSLDGYGAKRNSSFAGKANTVSVVAGFRSAIDFWVGSLFSHVDVPPPEPTSTIRIAHAELSIRSGSARLEMRSSRGRLKIST